MTDSSAARHQEDRDLAQRVVAGDRDAFDSFCELYPRLYRFVAKRLDADPETIGEITQNTVYKALDNLSSFRGDSTLFSWMCGIGHFEILSWFKQRKKARAHLDVESFADYRLPEPLVSGEADDPGELQLRAETATAVHEVLDGLPGHYGEVLEWKYAEHLPVKEIAARLGVSPKAAESTLTRAREAFRRAWTEAEERARSTSPVEATPSTPGDPT